MPAASLRRALAAAFVLVPLYPAAPAAAQCNPQWNEGFAPLGPQGIRSLAVLQEGSEEVLYAGGDFDGVSDNPQIGLARWDGSRWTPIPSDREAQVTRLAVYDDGLGGGPAVFAAGSFRTAEGNFDRIRKWTGTQWLTLPHPAGNPSWWGAMSVRVVRIGSAEQLLVFGGQHYNSLWTIVRWAGDHWDPVGEPAIGMIHDIVAFDAGEFAGSLACFDGKTWRLDTAGPRPGRLITDPVIRRLEVFDPDGDGPAPAEIIAAGNFASIGDQQIAFIARWDGAVWRSLGDGVNGEVTALAVIDRGNGPRLYVGGAFTTAGGMPAKRAAVWDGNSWAPLGEGFNERVTAFVPFDDGSSAPGIAVGGIFSEAAGQPAAGLAMWDGAALHVAGATLAPHRSVGKVAVIPDGEGGQQLVVAMSASETPSNAVRIFDGRRWTTIGLADNSVSELAWLDLGDGGALYVGGRFTQIGGVAALRIARWDGSAWLPLGDGIDGEVVSALAVFDDGAGPRLYAGGKFESAGGIPAAGLAAWDGAAWSVPTLPFPQGGVRSMAVFDPDGDGPEPRALYVGGQFVPTPEVPAFAIARWDGATWSALGSGLWHSKRPPVVYSLAVLDEDGDGPASPALYAAGSFTQAGSVLALNLFPLAHPTRTSRLTRTILSVL